jgi:galactokinase
VLGLARKTAEEFEVKFGYRPTGVWSAPGRVNIIGEHTDYNEGFVLPIAINRATYAAIALREDKTARVASTFSNEVVELELDKLGEATGWAAYPLGVAHILPASVGFDLLIDSDVPVGAGLSSSAAIECAVALGLDELLGLENDRRALARVGQRAENEVVGAPTGIMDQSASLLGKADHAVFLDCQSLVVENVELGFAAAGLELVIIDTRVAHRLNDGGYATRRAACEAAARAFEVPSLRHLTLTALEDGRELVDDLTYRRARHVVTENARVLSFVEALKLGDFAGCGQLMVQSHASMRDDFEISVDELDTAVEISMRHGALGARMTGGGFGGAAIALCPIEKISDLTNSVYAEFELLGYAKPEIFTVNAADGASRLI